MLITIREFNTGSTPFIVEINFFMQNELSMEMVFNNNEAALEFRRMLNGGKRLHEMDGPKLHFKLTSNENNNKIKLTGNIYNALQLALKENLINASLINTITANPDANDIVNKSKKQSTSSLTHLHRGHPVCTTDAVKNSTPPPENNRHTEKQRFS